MANIKVKTKYPELEEYCLNCGKKLKTDKEQITGFCKKCVKMFKETIS